ncbi:sarcosine oxidase subunit gamma [Curvivirga sp.]|uniref:sarcosine oxidase subunit gamma n=1 Tax=Curvivirga sp. TaxID=2856848 RepID=UPI003B59DA6D
MVETAIKKVSPLDGLAGPVGGNVKLTSNGFVGKVIIRGDSDNKDFVTAVKDVTGVDIPTTALTFNEGETYSIYWMGPDEWMIMTPEDGEVALETALREKLGETPSQVVNVSDYYASMRLSGPAAREVLKKGSPLDLHPSKFKAGNCTGTRFAHATIFMVQRDEESTYDINVRISFAEYLWNYFVEASREFG